MKLFDFVFGIGNICVQSEWGHHEFLKLVQFLELFNLFKLTLVLNDLLGKDLLLLS